MPSNTSLEEAIYIESNIVPRMKELVARGAGLAGPQIGIAKKFFVAKELQTGIFRLYFNAEYFDGRDPVDIKEGCLSYPDLDLVYVKRYNFITITYQVLLRNRLVTKIENISGIRAIIFQHECDHIASPTRTIYKYPT